MHARKNDETKETKNCGGKKTKKSWIKYVYKYIDKR